MAPTIVITRPERQAKAFAAALEAAHGTPLPLLIAPLMKIVPVALDGPFVAPDHVIFTSANAVAQVDRLQIAPTVTAWCVGDQTADAARAAGFAVENAQGTSADLIAQIIAARPKGQIVHLRGAHATGDVADTLQVAGLKCEAHVVYAQDACPASLELRDLLASPQHLIVPLFSSRSARLLAESASISAPMTVVAMSESVAAAAEAIPSAEVFLANFPDKTAMIAATLREFDAICGPKTP